MSQLEAVDRSVGALAAALSSADDALVEACRGLAALIDAGKTTPGIWQQYLIALRDLADRAGEAADEDGEGGLVLHLSTAVGDSQNGES